MSKLIKNLLFAAVLAVIAWVGYNAFFSDSDPALTASNASINSQAARDAQEFLTKLQQLRTIRLDGELFDDPRFDSLIDTRQPVIEEPAGRSNPFTPVSG